MITNQHEASSRLQGDVIKIMGDFGEALEDAHRRATGLDRHAADLGDRVAYFKSYIEFLRLTLPQLTNQINLKTENPHG